MKKTRKRPMAAAKRGRMICEEDVVFASLTLPSETMTAYGDPDQCRKTMIDRILGKVRDHIKTNKIRCRGRCLEGDDLECTLEIVCPNLRKRIRLFDGTLINLGASFREKWKCEFKKTRFDFRCVCLDTMDIA